MPCYYQEATDGQLRCLPQSNVVAYYFSNATCTTPAAMAPACVSSAYAIQYRTAANMCSTQVAVFSVGQQIGTLYTLSGASCVAAGVPAGSAGYALTELAPSGFASATLQ